MSQSGMSRSAVLATVIVAAGTGVCAAQVCTPPWSVAALADTVVQTKDHDAVLRACAIAGDSLTVALRSRAAPGQSLWEPAGAAQVCLAKLGDEVSLRQLENELNRGGFNRGAIDKLSRVATHRSLTILIDYLARYQDDRSRILDMGDVAWDPLWGIVRALDRTVVDGPRIDGKHTPLEQISQRWRDWWQAGDREAFPPRGAWGARDARAGCLVRKIEWGFPRALLDLATEEEHETLDSTLRMLAGPDSSQAAMFGSLRGNAQTAMALRGDEPQFRKIETELGTTRYLDAIAKLEFLGDLRSVGALVTSLDSSRVLSAERLTPWQIAQETPTYFRAVLRTLARMVKSPPVPADAAPTAANLERWRAWWAAGPSVEALTFAFRGPVE